MYDYLNKLKNKKNKYKKNYFKKLKNKTNLKTIFLNTKLNINIMLINIPIHFCSSNREFPSQRFNIIIRKIIINTF